MEKRHRGPAQLCYVAIAAQREINMLLDDRSEQSRKLLGHLEIHTQWQSDYLNPDMDRFYDVAFADILKAIGTGPGQNLLDAGCGYAYHTVRLARSGARVTAVDFSEVALSAARQTLERAGLSDAVELRRADLTTLPFADSTFDSIVSWGVLMHIPSLEAALAELSRVLKPGGFLVLCENNANSLDVVVREPVLRLMKRVLGRKGSLIVRNERGVEAWTEAGEGGLMVRKTDLNFLTDFLASRGVQETKRWAGQFTEAYTNVRPRWAKRGIYAFNMIYYKNLKWAALAMGNIIVFSKT